MKDSENGQQTVRAAIGHPSWDDLILICKSCRKRRDGPDDMKPKSLGKLSRSSFKHRKRRPRVLFTGCLGLCPKRATAMAYVERGMLPRIVAIESRAQLADVMPMLIAPAT